MKRFLLALVILLLIPFAALSADSEYEEYLKTYDLSFLDKLDSDTYEYLEELGISDFDYESISSISLKDVFNYLSNIIINKSNTPLKSGLILIAIIIFSSLFDSINNEINKGEINSLYKTISNLAISIFIVVNITNCILVSASTIKLCADFSFAFFPVFCVIIATNGGAATSISANTMLLTLAQGMNYFTDMFFIPITNCFLALGICSSLREELNISSIVDSLKAIITKLISIVSAIFVSILSIKTSISARADVLGIRSIRFAINSVVPVIGGTISEGLLSIQSYSSLIKSSVGIVGIISIFTIFMPSIIEVNIWRIVFSLSAVCSDSFGNKSCSKVLKAFSNTLLIIDVILIFSMVTTIISIGILVAAKTVV